MTGIEATTIIIDKLKENSGFISMLTQVDDSYPAIISGIVLPTEWPVTYRTVNIYVLSELGTSEYYKIRLSANCRGNTYIESRDIAYALQKAVNRWNVMGFSVVAEVSSTLQPDDAGVDNFLTTVELLVRSN